MALPIILGSQPLPSIDHLPQLVRVASHVWVSPQCHWRKITPEEQERYALVKNTYRPFELPINKMWPATLIDI